jgi:hypothetical protein
MADKSRPEAVRRTEESVDRATGAPHQSPKYAHEGGGTDRSTLENEQRGEASQSSAGPGVPASTDAQAKGLGIGSLVGGAIGLLLFLPLAFIPIAGLSLPGRLLICAIAGALAGGTGGAMYMGGRQPELEGQTVDSDGRPSVGTTLRDPGTNSRGR